MAKLTFPPNPDANSEVTTGDITWKWNGYSWYAIAPDVEAGASVSVGDNPPSDPSDGDLWWNSSDDSGRLYVYYVDANSSQWVEASPQGEPLTEGDADGLYLSKVNDDTAAGEITFKGLTTHEKGVKVTGGLYNDAARPVVYGNDSIRISAENAAFSSFITLNDKSTSGVTIYSAHGNTGSGARNLHLIYGGTGHTATFVNSLNDIQSDVGAGQNINVYGYQSIIANQTCTGNVIGYSSNIYEVHTGDAYNFYAAGNAPNYFEGRITSPGTFNNTNTNTSNTLRISSTGILQRSTSSRRYKDNIRDCPEFGSGSALDFVSQVQPRMWEDHSTGETVCGFIAEELFELGGEHLVSFSPWSREVTSDETNDEGEVIGTRTTRQHPFIGNGSTPVTKDGGALTDDSEVVDGINGKGIVITLVKALQEAATKIDTLETRLAALEGA